MFRPFLASDTVRFVGDIVAVVLSETREGAVDAAELVEVDYEPLPVVTDIVEAARDEVLLFPEVGTNMCGYRPLEATDLFASCEVTTSGTTISQRLAACPLEPRADRSPSRGQWPHHGVAVDPDAAPGQDGTVDAPRARGRSGPRRGARRRRRLRGQGPGRRGRADRIPGAQDRPAASLDRDAQREPGRDAPRPRAADRLRDRRQARRDRGGAALADPPGRRRVSRPWRVPAQPDRDDGQRRLPDPEASRSRSEQS